MSVRITSMCFRAFRAVKLRNLASPWCPGDVRIARVHWFGFRYRRRSSFVCRAHVVVGGPVSAVPGLLRPQGSVANAHEGSARTPLKRSGSLTIAYRCEMWA